MVRLQSHTVARLFDNCQPAVICLPHFNVLNRYNTAGHWKAGESANV